jgi:hypothetical protein
MIASAPADPMVRVDVKRAARGIAGQQTASASDQVDSWNDEDFRCRLTIHLEEDHLPLVNAAAQPHAQLSPGGIGLQFDVHLLQRPAGAAVDPLLNVGAEGLQLQGPELLALLMATSPLPCLETVKA